MPNKANPGSPDYQTGYSRGYAAGLKGRKYKEIVLTPFQRAILDLAAKLPPQLIVDALKGASNGFAGHLNEQCNKFLPEGIKGDTIKAINATLDPLLDNLEQRKPKQQ